MQNMFSVLLNLSPKQNLISKHNSLTLLRDTNSLPPAASGLGVLTTDSKAPVVPQSTVISA